MNEALHYFIGKECILSTVGTRMTLPHGIVKSITGDWLTMEIGKPGKEHLHMFNVRNIKQICEYPTDKNGKKKSVFFGIE